MLKDKHNYIRAIFVARGAALVEFALVLPLILLFLAGIYTLARAQSQINILAQAGYQIAFVGATTTNINKNGDYAMLTQGAKIIQISQSLTNYLDNTLTMTRPTGTPGGVITNSGYDVDASGTTYVEVEIQGNVKSIFHYFLPSLFTLTVDVTAPYLNGGISQSGNLVTGTLNPAAQLSCDGTTTGTPSDCASLICGCQQDVNHNCLSSGITPICYPPGPPP